MKPNCDSHPSLPNRFRASLFVEVEGWDATIKVDYDRSNPLIMSRIKRVRKECRLQLCSIERAEVFETRKGHHLRLYSNKSRVKLTAGEILYLQAQLGDDPMRQKLNAERVRKNEVGWNVLWNKKVINNEVWSIEEYDQKLSNKIRKIFGLPESIIHP